MSNDDPKKPKMFSQAWYDEYFSRAAISETHARFCERVYGQDLCQHGLMNMRELDLLVSLIEPGSRVLEVGCSNGRITEYIHDRTRSAILGLDFSDVAIEQARQLTRDKADTLRFERVDLTQEPIPGKDYDAIILIDSLYFLGDFDQSLPKFGERLGPSGKMLISVFEVQEDEDPDGVLLPDGTYLAQALRKLGFEYAWYDFTADVREHGVRNYQVGEELKEDFVAEGNAFLYEARAAENRFFKEHAEKEEIARYLYVATPLGRTRIA